MSDFGAFAGRPCPEWYREPQLGIFVHWGIFAVPAWAPRGESITDLTRNDYDNVFARAPYAEWYANALRIPDSETSRHHARVYGAHSYESFRPDFEVQARAFDAGVWADLFAAAGARYVVFVTKHHDGYCLWPTAVSNPHSPGWNAQRDYVGELAYAVRRCGMRFGLYYSGGLDWTFYNPPIRDLGDMFACVPLSEDYKDYALRQVRELIDRYEPSVLWNDIAWPDDSRLPELFAYYYEKVLDGAVNDRWMGNVALFGALHDPAIRKSFNDTIKARLAEAKDELATPSPPHCDFRTVEYGSGAAMGGQKWESTRGLGLAFGYNANERRDDYLTVADLIALYRDVTTRGGNLLINVGPRADASIPDEQSTPLRGLGRFLAANR